MEPIYVTKPFLPPIEEYITYLRRIWETSTLTNFGPLHQELEYALKKRFEWNNVSLCANGHLALEIALKSLNLTSGGEIITTPFTFVSTISAIVNQGFTPVFCDVCDGFTIDTERIEPLITEKTVAILPVHVYGVPCDVIHIEQIARKHSLSVLYDAAHAFGVKIGGVDIAKYGDISMFSFHATKLFHTIEGGSLVYTNDELKKTIELSKNFGISGPESIDLVGMNAKMNEFQAAMGLLSLKYFSENVTKRKALHDRYLRKLESISEITVKRVRENTTSNYSYMPVLLESKSKRDGVFDYLSENNVFSRKYFYPSISKVGCYKKYLRGNSLEVAEDTADRVITLPLYHSLEFSQVDYICDIIHRALYR